MATLKDVSELSGYTVTTISRMLNGRGYVSKKAREEILNAMTQLNYHPNELARSLSMKSNNTIGLIVPSASNPYFCMVIDCVERYASLHGYKLLLCNSNQEVEKEVEYFNMLTANKVAGVIVASHTMGLDQMVSSDATIISIERSLSPSTPSIYSNNYQGGQLAAEHLIKKKCKKLAHISGSSELKMDTNKRFDGFRDACEKSGISYVSINATEDRFVSLKYEDIIKYLLDTYPDIDGIFTSNDVIAAQVVQICTERKIKIPQDIKVVGYDDIALCTLTCPKLTTIHQPVDDICKYAVESIISKSKKEAVPSQVVFDVSLVERGTT